jgi:predicted alpha/beta hydrolase
MYSLDNKIIEIHQNAVGSLKGFLHQEKETSELKGSVLICPAMGITANYYFNLSAWLAEQGYRVLCIDYQGTGISMSKNPTEFTGDLLDWVENIERAGKWMKKDCPTIPLIFLGHSIGSQLFGFIKDKNLFERAIFLASSTGYWRDGHSFDKWKNLFLLNTILPISNFIWGYTNAKFFRQGENYPKGVAMQWRKWCLNKNYLGIELTGVPNTLFSTYSRTITSIWFTDDPIANASSVPKLMDFFIRAKKKIIAVDPEDIGVSKIGHTGFMSRKMKNTLWVSLLPELNIPASQKLSNEELYNGERYLPLETSGGTC